MDPLTRAWTCHTEKKNGDSSETITYSDEYAFIIGKVGIKKDEYFALTPAETYALIDGYIYNRDILSSNFRALFWLNFNQWSKNQKSAESLWPLSIDEQSQLSMEDIYERNKKIIESMGAN